MFSEEGIDPDEFTFKHGTKNSNILLQNVDLSEVKEVPLGFIPNEMIEDELVKVLVKRFFSHDGTLNIDDYKDTHVDKSFTVKVLNDYSIGHISDVILNFSATRDVDLFGVRSYIFHLLSYMSMLEKADLISYPVELDCGITAKSFFIQMSCLDNGVMLNNIEDYMNNKESHQGMLINRLVESSQFLDIMGLKISNKLVFTSCWFTEEYRENKGLLIHGIDKFRKCQHSNGQSVGSFIDHSLENLSKTKRISNIIPINYSKLDKEKGNHKEIINPLKVKKVLDFLLKDKSIVQGKSYSEEDLKDLLVDYPDQSFIHKLRKEEVEAVIDSLRDEEIKSVLEKETNIVRSRVSNQELMEKMIQSIKGMTESEAVDFFEGNGAIPDFQRVRGQGDNRGEKENTLISGSFEGDIEESFIVKGQAEKAVELIEGPKGEKGEKRELESHTDPAYFHNVKGAQESNEPSLTKVKGSNPIINQDNSVWEIKKLRVINEIQEKMKSLSDHEVSQDEINAEIQKIIAQELGVENKKSEKFIEAVSDSVVEEIVEEGIIPVNEQIKQRIALEKTEGQLAKRNQQVEKMNQLINRLKETNGQLIQKNKELDGEVKKLRFKEKKGREVINEVENKLNKEDKEDKEDSLNKLQKDIIHVIEDETKTDSSDLKLENDKLRSQIEQLKKKISFMYENNKINDTKMDASDVQNMLEKSEELRGQVTSYRAEIEKLKNESRDQEATIKNMTKELKEKESLVKEKLQSAGGSQSKTLEAENKSLKDSITSLEAEKKELHLKNKSFEQKFKFMNAQIDRFKKNEQKIKGAGNSGISDAQAKNKVKQLEVINGRMKQAYSKVEKELGDKKAELHKMGLENKTLTVKLRELEKKIDILARKAS